MKLEGANAIASNNECRPIRVPAIFLWGYIQINLIRHICFWIKQKYGCLAAILIHNACNFFQKVTSKFYQYILTNTIFI